MRAVIQRVATASVSIKGKEHAAIGPGFLILLGVAASDTEADAAWLAKKIIGLRIFADESGHMNKNILEAGGAVLVISQFTLFAAYKKGNRPSFITAARPEAAVPLYEYLIRELTALLGKPAATGVFGADMQVTLTNDGPVTILMDTQNKE